MLEKDNDDTQNSKTSPQLANPEADKLSSYSGAFPCQISVPQATDSRNSPNPIFRGQAETYSLIDTLGSLPMVLFDLRRQRDRLYSEEPTTPVCDSQGVGCEILQQVSGFIEVTQTCISRISTTLDGSNAWGAKTIFHLGLMIISTAVEIYALLIQNDGALFSPPLQLKSSISVDGNDARRRHRSLTANSFWHTNSGPTMLDIYFPPRLELVLYLTITDYHLIQFQWLLSQLSNLVTINALPITGPPSKELKKIQDRISQVRASIRSSVERLQDPDRH